MSKTQNIKNTAEFSGRIDPLVRQPLYNFDGIKIYKGDFFDVCVSFAPGSYDLIIADPPYGDDAGYGRNNKEIANNENETINYRIMDVCWKLLKPDTNLYLFTNWKFADRLKTFAGWYGYNVRMELAVIKNNWGMGYGFRNQYEKCLVLEKGKPKYRMTDFSNVQNMEHINHNNKTHPHEKGVNLIGKIIEHSSGKGDLILDPTIGSGSTLVAAKKLGRKADGVELDEHWCNVAIDRLSQNELF